MEAVARHPLLRPWSLVLYATLAATLGIASGEPATDIEGDGWRGSAEGGAIRTQNAERRTMK